MKAKQITSLLVWLSLVTVHVNAQESVGIRTSNYAPTQSIFLNPSSIADSKTFIDIHLAGLSVFARNNFVYLSTDSFSIQQALNAPNTVGGPSFRNDRDNYRAYVNAHVQGPSASVVLGDHSFAITTGARTAVDVRGLNSKMSSMITDGFQAEKYHGTENRMSGFRATALSWAELGLGYGRILGKKGNRMLTAGVHVKRIIGISGGGIRLNDWHFTVQDSSTMTTHNIKGQYGFNEPAWKSGKGWGVDIGFTIKETLQDVSGYSPHQKRTGCRTCDYRYKFSMAILDIGRVSFKPPFYSNEFNNETEYQWEGYGEIDPEDEEDLSLIIDQEFDISRNRKDNLRVWLPTALSTQLDYRLANHLYVNASMIVGVPWRNSLGVQRAALLSLTPRFESKRFEFSLPLQLHEARDPMLGAMIRLNGNIIIGTDHIGTYLFNKDRYGADIYFHLKHSIFKNPSCKEKGDGMSPTKRRFRLKRVKKKKGPPPCASW